VEPADNVTSIFTARRDLLLTTRQVVRGSGLSVEECDFLISLYGARVLGWNDIGHDRQGYVTFHQLQEFVVHNPSLLSRRLRKLAAAKPSLLEIEGAAPASGLHFNSKRVRITDEGIKRIEPVWKRFQHMSVKLLEGVSPRLLIAHHEVNQKISARIRALRSGLNNILDKPQPI
jgi:hypothetical protein